MAPVQDATKLSLTVFDALIITPAFNVNLGFTSAPETVLLATITALFVIIRQLTVLHVLEAFTLLVLVVLPAQQTVYNVIAQIIVSIVIVELT